MTAAFIAREWAAAAYEGACGSYPLQVDGIWRETCRHPEHWWQEIATPQPPDGGGRCGKTPAATVRASLLRAVRRG